MNQVAEHLLINCVRDDRFRLGDRDSCYFGYENRDYHASDDHS